MDDHQRGDRSGVREVLTRAYGLPLVGIVIFLIFAVLLFVRAQQGDHSTSTAPPPSPPVAGASAVPGPAASATPTPTSTKSQEEAPPTVESTTTADCVLDPATVVVRAVSDREEQSAATAGLVMQVWDVTFANQSDQPITVFVHVTGTMGDAITSDLWMPVSVTPNGTDHISGKRDLTQDGKPVYNPVSSIPDRAVVVSARKACEALVDDPQVQAQAVEVPAPPVPSG
jgi:hypothetical protein